MPAYGLPPPQQRRGPTAAEGAVDVVPSAGGRGRAGPPPGTPIPGQGPSMAMQGQMPPPQPGGVPIAGGMPGGMGAVPIGGGMGMPPPGMPGMQPDPIQQLIAALRRQSSMPATNAPQLGPFLQYLMQSGMMGGGGGGSY